jgi:hypothetical protein
MSNESSAAQINDREWVAWGYANLSPEEAERRRVAVNLDREARGEQPITVIPQDDVPGAGWQE